MHGRGKRGLNSPPYKKILKVSVISTVLNEGGSLGELLRGLSQQTFPPEEIVIVDAGSTDETLSILKSFHSFLPLKVLVSPGCTRGQGRNIAIREATGEIIASIDGGCVPYPDWLEKLIAPFGSESPPDVVAGFYEPIVETPLQEALAGLTIPSSREIDPMSFLPSSRSVAFRKEIWKKVGGYPEWMRSAEDTLFDISLKKAGAKFYFQPEARVKWRIRNSLRAIYRQFYEYAYWDASEGVFFPHYYKPWFYLFGLVLCLTLPFLWFKHSLLLTASLLAFILSLFGVYLCRALRRASRRRHLSPKAMMLFPFVLLAYDMGLCVGYLTGKLRKVLKDLKTILSFKEVAL